MSTIKSLILALILTPLMGHAQVYESVASWRYVAVDAKFWDSLEESRQKKDFPTILELAMAKQKNAKTDLEKAEADYVIATACMDLGYFYCAYDSALAVLKKNPGSMPAIGSLYIMEKLIQQELVIEDEVQRILNVGNFKEVPEDLIPMVSFYVFKDNLKRNLKEWQQESLKKVYEGSYWKSRLDFFRSLLLVQSGKSSAAEKYLQSLEKAVEKFPRFQQTIRLQRARLLYEAGDYKEADLIYESFAPGEREYGKIILERAWLKYFQKDYSLSLGMLESLKAPFFRTATHPEQYLLAMVAYRDICHYDEVVELHREFEKVFKPWVEHLKENKPLFENKALLSMVLLQAQNLRIGNMIGRIRSEREQIKSSELASEFKDKMRSVFEIGEVRWKDHASQALESDLKAASLEFLDFVEQTKLLEYISGLDKYRVKARFEDRQYKAPEAEKYAIEKLFWPVNGEYWREELNSYRVLVSDRCGGG